MTSEEVATQVPRRTARASTCTWASKPVQDLYLNCMVGEHLVGMGMGPNGHCTPATNGQGRESHVD